MSIRVSNGLPAQLAFAAHALALTLLLAAPAHALGSDEGDRTECPKGQIWDADRKACVKAAPKAVSDEAMADYAHVLARAGRYEEALATLDLLQDPQTAEALNYRGYATRKLGRVDEGIGYYLQAVEQAPHYVLVREYLGEAYVQTGRLALARDQLALIETECGRRCESYEALSQAIAKAPGL